MKKNLSWRPDATQDLLLKAALLPPESAVFHWRLWQDAVDIEEIDYASFRLLPLLYENLKSAGIDGSALSRYRSVYRHFWYKNQLCLNRLGSFLEHCNQSQVGLPLLLKGVPLILNYYIDPALRPMADIDMLVAEEDLPVVFSILRNNGWVAKDKLPDRMTELWLLAARECHFRSREGIEIDLHWNLLQESFFTRDEVKQCMRRGREVVINGGRALLPDATDLLYHVLAHGVRWHAVHPLRWIPDIKFILERDGEEIDWSRIIGLARRDNLIFRFQKACQYLTSREINQFMSPAARRIIRNLDAEKWEASEFWFLSRRSEVWSDFPEVCFLAYRYSRKYSGWRKRWQAFIDFILYRWRVYDLRHLPREVIRRLGKRLKIMARNFSLMFERRFAA